MIKTAYRVALNAITTILGKIQWEWLAEWVNGRYYKITDRQQDEIRALLTQDYYIILTRRKTHLSTYMINLSHWLLTRFKRWGIIATRV